MQKFLVFLACQLLQISLQVDGKEHNPLNGFRRRRSLKTWTSLATCLQAPSNMTSTAKNVLELIKKNHLIVSLHNSYNTSPRPLANSAPVRTKACPFKYEMDDDPNRLPQYLAKAVCPGCSRFCQALKYSVQVLVWKCENVWVQAEKKLDVAFL